MAAKLSETVAVAAHACRDSLLRAETLIQLGLIPKPHSHTQRVPHIRQVYNWCAHLRHFPAVPRIPYFLYHI